MDRSYLQMSGDTIPCDSAQSAYEDPDPLVRLRRLTTGWSQLFYSLHRTEIMRTACWHALDVDPLGGFLGERLTGYYALLAGKIALLPIPHLLRSAHEDSTSVRVLDHRRTFLSPDFGAHYARFVSHMSERMKDTLGDFPPESELWIGSLISDHLAY